MRNLPIGIGATMLLWILGPSALSGADLLRDRWSLTEVSRLVQAINNNDRVALQSFATEIDGRESLDLRAIDLSGRILRNSWVLGEWEVHFDRANLAGSKWLGVDLRGAHFNQVDARNSHWAENTVLDYALVENADFRGAVFSDVSAVGSRIENCRFEGASFKEASFFAAPYIRANFAMTQLEQVNFRSASLQKSSFFQAVLTNVDFSDTDLKSVVFSRASLFSVSLDDSFLLEPNFENAVSREVGLLGTKLLRPNLRGWNFEDLDLRYVIWAGDDFDLGGARQAHTGVSLNQRQRLKLLQLRNTYSALKGQYEKYGYTEIAEEFGAKARRADNQLNRSDWLRIADWLANDLTHAYGRAPSRLLIAAVFCLLCFGVLYFLISLTQHKWCFVIFSEVNATELPEGGEEIQKTKEIEWLMRGSALSARERMISCLGLSARMMFYSAGKVLKIPDLLQAFGVRQVEFRIVGPMRWLCGGQAVLGLWFLYLLVKDLVRLIGD